MSLTTQPAQPSFPYLPSVSHSCHCCSTWVTRCFYPISLPLSSTMPPKQSKKSGHVSFWLKTNKNVPPLLLITKRELQASEHSAELVQASPFPHCPGPFCFGSEGLQPAPQSILQFRPYGFSMLFPLLRFLPQKSPHLGRSCWDIPPSLCPHSSSLTHLTKLHLCVFLSGKSFNCCTILLNYVISRLLFSFFF